MESDDNLPVFNLCPKDFPRRIELELSEKSLEQVNLIVLSSGRSLSEVVTDILSKTLYQ
jgi:hypothetical protein